MILVTGASGFIGSHLVERLVQKGADVRALIHYNSRNDWGRLEWLPKHIQRNFEIYYGDVQDPTLMKKAMVDCQVVFHLAALIAIPYSYEAPQSYIRTNVEGTLNVMQTALEAGVEKVIHTSTSECYGTAQYVPIDEKHPLQGQSPYSASKIGADMVAESYYRSFGLPVAIIRPFNTYGPRQSARAVIPTIISQLLIKQPLRLGNLHPTRDLTFVSDLVRGFIKIAESSKGIGTVINIGNGHEISIGELAKKIMMRMGTDEPIITDGQRLRPDKSEVERLFCDNTKARKLLGWQPEVSLDQGLMQTIEWVKEHPSVYKANIYNI